MIDGLGASALGVWLAWVFRLEQITFKSRAHSLVLVSVLAIGAGAIWLCARHVGPAPATVREALPYVAALLGLFLTTSLPDRGVERLRRMLDANDANRNRLLASGGVALLLLVSIPLAQG
ncbi:MAG: hypothetical protein FJZ00_13525, partial [Candidatus Sericytochromatia bacterium]|nr:hypothetical protein [Candidatus Tanganyikabacteria bacterium]